VGHLFAQNSYEETISIRDTLEGVDRLGFVGPLPALAAAFLALGILLYRRVNLGIALISTASILGLLSLDLEEIPRVIWQTTEAPITLSLVGATFGIMLLSQLYRETKAIEALSHSLSKTVGRPRLVASILPAVIGLLPVAGGALMSAPMVETETDKLDLRKEKKTYVNIWFRHVIFPVYPMSQVLILTAALTGTSVNVLVLRQIPVVIAMISIGYVIGFRRSSAFNGAQNIGDMHTNLKTFLLMFSPILAMILSVLLFKFDVWIAALIGVVLLVCITRPGLTILRRVFSNKAIYMISLAAYGAMLLRGVTMASGVSEAVGEILAGGTLDSVLLLATIPAILGFLVGSPSGGIAISVPMLAGSLSFTAPAASLLYISAFFGYLGAPTHLCLVLTADYFKCQLSKLYKYMIPSLAISFATALVVYALF